jgi:hypothetical protein
MDRRIIVGVAAVAMSGLACCRAMLSVSKSRRVSNCWGPGLLSPLSLYAQMAANSQRLMPIRKASPFLMPVVTTSSPSCGQAVSLCNQ